MDIRRVMVEIDEVVSIEEESPLVRSLSMSRNMALSVLDEVPHMIKLAPNASPSPQALRKSSSTSSLARLIKKDKRKKGNRGGTVSEMEQSADQIHSQFLSFPADDPAILRAMKTEGVSFVETNSSLSQIAFPSVRCVKKNDVLSGIVVSRWDNIVGPQCVYLWTEEVTSLFYPAVLPQHLSGVVKYVTDHTVDHQEVDGGLCRPSTQRVTLCIVPDLSLVYISLAIRVPSEVETVLEFASSSSMTANDPDQPTISVPHAISVLGNLKFLSHFLLLRPLINNWLNEFSPKIGVLLCKNKLQSSMINSWCAELCKTMTSLKTCWVQEEILSSPVPLKNRIKTKPEAIKEPVIQSDLNFIPPSTKHVPQSHWGPLLTSHLSTFGSSIIVGYDNLAVNQVIRFLLCFSSIEEGYCSRYTLASLPDTFMKGLFIQGLTLGGIGEKSISFNQISSNKFPLSHAELGSKAKIRQMNPSTHEEQRGNLLMHELRALWTSTPFVSPPANPFPLIVKDTAEFVKKLFDDLLLLPYERRYGRLLMFRRALQAKAISLVSYLHAIKLTPLKERAQLKRLIPELFGYDEQEFIIVQVAAERIRPGVIGTLHSA